VTSPSLLTPWYQSTVSRTVLRSLIHGVLHRRRVVLRARLRVEALEEAQLQLCVAASERRAETGPFHCVGLDAAATFNIAYNPKQLIAGHVFDLDTIDDPEQLSDGPVFDAKPVYIMDVDEEQFTDLIANAAPNFDQSATRAGVGDPDSGKAELVADHDFSIGHNFTTTTDASFNRSMKCQNRVVATTTLDDTALAGSFHRDIARGTFLPGALLGFRDSRVLDPGCELFTKSCSGTGVYGVQLLDDPKVLLHVQGITPLEDTGPVTFGGVAIEVFEHKP
jgi:hypothetical protein